MKFSWVIFVVLFLNHEVRAQSEETLLDPSETPPMEYPAPTQVEGVESFAETPTQEEIDRDAPLQQAPVNVIVKDLVEKDSKGIYYYSYEKKSDDRRSGYVRFGLMSPPAISTLIQSVNSSYELTYKEMYTNNNVPLVMYDMEWAIFDRWRGLRAHAGVGGFFAQGFGRFATQEQEYDGTLTNIAREKYNFIGIPVNAGLTLRFQIGESWFVPFALGGGSATALIETRSDGKKTNIVGAPSLYGGGGFMLDMAKFDHETGFILDRDYNFRHLWLVFEARILKSFSKELDISSNMVLLGIAADY